MQRNIKQNKEVQQAQEITYNTKMFKTQHMLSNMNFERSCHIIQICYSTNSVNNTNVKSS